MGVVLTRCVHRCGKQSRPAPRIGPDEQMLQFMGRENMKDYNVDFLVSWIHGKRR
jgi:hypothetical protein